MSGSSSTIGLVGAGGLGGPIAYAFASRGHRVVIVDDDRVELSNLQRQLQFVTADIGREKAVALADELLRRGHPAALVEAHVARFDAETADELMGSVDLIVDGSDNLETKFAVNDWAVARGKLAVIAGVMRYHGQVIGVAPGQSGCYRCLFEAPPADDGSAQSCAEAGVLGAVVAVVAGVAARVGCALMAGDTGDAGTLLAFDDITGSLAPRRITFRPRTGCAACAGELPDPNDPSIERKKDDHRSHSNPSAQVH